MKRVISILVLVMMILTSLVGCSAKKESEEELRAKIKAELEVEMASEQGSDNSEGSKVDMKDMDGLYEFVKGNIVDIPRDSFNTWEVHYFDITGDGTDEAILVSTYGVDWHESMEIISGDSGEYKRIPSDIPLGKYGNTPDFKDGFFVVTSRTGGTGAHYDYIDLYIYDGTNMVNVLVNLLITEEVASPDTSFIRTATIDGKLTDFIYTLAKFDRLKNKETIEKIEQYTYNANTMSFNIEQIKAETVNENQMTVNKSAEEADEQIPKSRMKFTNKQVEAIANDIVACFNMYSDQALSLDAMEAEYFSYYLVYFTSEKHIIDNYIPRMDSLVPYHLTEIKDGKVDGMYIEALGEAIFGLDVEPKIEYEQPMNDPGLVSSVIKELNKSGEKYVAKLDILDETDSPFLSMELHLSITKDGYTRVEYASTKSIN